MLRERCWWAECRPLVRVQQAAADQVVPGHAPDDAGEEQRVGAGAQAPPGCVVSDGLAAQAQADGGDAAARAVAPALRPPRDRRRLPWRADPERQGRPRLAQQGDPRGGGADHGGGRARARLPVQATLHQGIHQGLRRRLAGRAGYSRLRRLGCFTVVQGPAILHEPHVTGGGAASAKHPSFLAVNTALGNLKTALAGPYHAFGFDKYAHRYLAQVQYLFNRRYDLRAILVRLARAACQTNPCPLLAVRAAESSFWPGEIKHD